MSARSATGISERGELFTPKGEIYNDSKEANISQNESKEQLQGDFSPEAKKRQADVAYGIDNHKEDPLQLDHMLGYNGNYRRTLLMHPIDENCFIKSMGSLVSISSLNATHDQIFLRGHDMQVSCISASPSGRYLASGQLGTKHFRGQAAPIFVWNLETAERMIVLRGLTEAVTCLSFSDDERFLCGTGSDSLLYIWDLSTGEVVYGQRLLSPATILQWVESIEHMGRVSYELVIGVGPSLCKAMFTFEQLRVQWQLKLTPYQMPSSGGIIRTFQEIALTNDKRYIYVGTYQGEMMVFMRGSYVFRALIPVCTNGLTGLAVLSDGDVICTGGDGVLKRLHGNDMDWQCALEGRIALPPKVGISGVSVSSNNAEIMISASNGSVYRCLTDTLTDTLLTQAHIAPVKTISFGRHPSMFVTGSSNGEIRVWDLTDYACLSVMSNYKAGSVNAVAMTDDLSVIAGWEDGSICCYDNTLSRQKWIIPGAHRSGVSCLTVYQDDRVGFVLTGGNDGGVRVWKLTTRELVAEYTDHSKAVVSVLVDVKQANIIHSVGMDSCVVSFDLKQVRRLQSHVVKTSAMHAGTQRKDGELEVITADNMGRLLHFDVDIREPVLSIQDPTRSALNQCVVSPSGRYLAFAGDDTLIKVMDINSGVVLSLGQGHSTAVRSLQWTPDERQIISGADDACLCVWNFFLGGDENNHK